MSRKPGQVIIGRIYREFGLTGEMKVEILTDFPERFADAREVHVQDSAGNVKDCTIEYTRMQLNHALVKFKGVDTPEDAEKLRGLYIMAATDTVLPLQEGSYYSFDLVGLEVYTPEGVRRGIITAIERYPAQDVLIVDTGESLLMVPAVHDFLVDIDMTAGKIVLAVPEGLPELPKARPVT